MQMRDTSVRGLPTTLCGRFAEACRLLRADQKAKTRSRLGPSSPAKKGRNTSEAASAEIEEVKNRVVEDNMVFFWQCQSPGQTGDLRGCGFFRILDMKAEGRGPCIGED
jgi:hypothetical protein